MCNAIKEAVFTPIRLVLWAVCLFIPWWAKPWLYYRIYNDTRYLYVYISTHYWPPQLWFKDRSTGKWKRPLQILDGIAIFLLWLLFSVFLCVIASFPLFCVIFHFVMGVEQLLDGKWTKQSKSKSKKKKVNLRYGKMGRQERERIKNLATEDEESDSATASSSKTRNRTTKRAVHHQVKETNYTDLPNYQETEVSWGKTTKDQPNGYVSHKHKTVKQQQNTYKEEMENIKNGNWEEVELEKARKKAEELMHSAIGQNLRFAAIIPIRFMYAVLVRLWDTVRYWIF